MMPRLAGLLSIMVYRTQKHFDIIHLLVRQTLFCLIKISQYEFHKDVSRIFLHMEIVKTKQIRVHIIPQGFD